MKKAWKWALTLMGIAAICVVALWVDSYYRAVAAIRAEDERLVKDIAAFRARLHPGLPIDDAFLAGSAVAPLSFYQGAVPAKLEDGHSGHQNFTLTLRADYYGLSVPSPDLKAPGPIRPGAAELSNLALTFRTIRECGYISRAIGYDFEDVALRKIEPLVTGKGLPATELRRIAGLLDRAMAARPPFADALEAQHLMDRAEVLRVLHFKADPTGMILRPPGWRELFSWRILLVKCLRQLDDDFSVLRQDINVTKFEKRDELTQSLLRQVSHVVRWRDRNCLGVWTAARVGTAVAIFRAERGCDPAKLQDLVPDYLPKLPLSPVHGDELGYYEGVVIIRVGESSITWPLR